jgi:hypothetical protein
MAVGKGSRGVSDIVSFITVVFIIMTATVATYLWAVSAISGLNEPGRTSNYLNQMVSLDYIVRSTAHGDINFSHTFEFYHPTIEFETTFIELRPWNDTTNTSAIALTYNQRAQILGKAGSTTTETKCLYGSQYVYDARTKIVLYKESNVSRVYKGAKAEGPGAAEIMVCYQDIRLVHSGECGTGKIGPRTVIRIRKINVTENGVPVVGIGMC